MPLRSFFSVVALIILLGCNGTTNEPVESGNEALDKLKLPEGFTAEHVYSPSKNNRGSWVAMTFDNRGRLITSDQYGYLYRVTLPPIGEKGAPRIDSIYIESQHPGDTSRTVVDIGFAHGLLYAFNSLYVVVNHWPDSVLDKGSGVYRLEDTNGNDQFDKVTLLKSLEGSGEHGPHSLKLSPDGKSIYLVAGNFTRLPDVDESRLPPVWQDDNLFPLLKDPRGHDGPPVLPAGWIAKFTPDGSRWELVAAGLRNTFDIAFNHHGELFAYDSDMEWDLGLPWYRPTRIYHVPAGSEFGWRTGTGKWPEYFPDVVPPVLNIGQGSPTNLVSGLGSGFSEKYERALFAFDWSFGIIYAIHLSPTGASYSAEAEEFLSGAPLPLTDGVFGPDGALYFLTGGRSLESDLYRVYSDRKQEQKTKHLEYDTADVHPYMKLRRQLESASERRSPSAIDLAWQNLDHQDRSVRYAARVALEQQPLSGWQERVFQEQNAYVITQVAIALAHVGDRSLRDRLVTKLTSIDLMRSTPGQRLDHLRAIELVLIRMGKPGADVAKRLVQYLDPYYPSESAPVNRALARLLIHLEAPGAIGKTLTLLENAQDEPDPGLATASSDLILRNAQYGLDIAKVLANLPPREQVYMAVVLSNSRGPWTNQQREKYFSWFGRAFGFKGGNSYIGFLNAARQMALQRVGKEQIAYYDSISGGRMLSQNGNDLAGLPRPKGPWRTWTVESASAVLDSGLTNRDFVNGKNMFGALLCQSCHSMNGEGGSIGPDLTRLGTRFSTRDMLVHIIEPDKEVSDQYAPYLFSLKNGKSVLAKLVKSDENSFYVSQNPFAPDVVIELKRNDVQSWKLSRVSLMPAGMINSLNGDELKDLFAFLVSGGNESHDVYKKD